MDFLGALLAIITLSPVLLALIVLVRFRLGSPVFFVQERTGLEGRSFRLIKFRSMTDARDASGSLLSDAERLPPFGRWLRSSSLDELPELWNILRGDMSLVGPRPLLPRYLPRYTPEQMRRHEVKPGLTGWSQINGRNATSWERRHALDVWYVEHANLWLDLRILVLTVFKVLRREGISSEGHATMPEFYGTEQLPEASDKTAEPDSGDSVEERR